MEVSMKLLTLNTHSLVEENYEEKLLAFVEMIKEEKPDVIALQEVNQSMTAKEAFGYEDTGFIPCKGFSDTIRADNHGYRLAKLLILSGVRYHWTWVAAKRGYDTYDEGMAFFTLNKMEDVESFFISHSTNYENWKTRKGLGISVAKMRFYNVHMSWWDDEDEPFKLQWEKFAKKIPQDETCFIMGDFNNPAAKKEEGYELILQSGMIDTWQEANVKDSGVTVSHRIDGWKDKTGEIAGDKMGMRIDYIFCNKKVPVEYSKVVCNEVIYPVVSDHYGVMVNIGYMGRGEKYGNV